MVREVSLVSPRSLLSKAPEKLSYFGESNSNIMPIKILMALLSGYPSTHPYGRVLVLNGSLITSVKWFSDREGLLMLLAASGKGYGLDGLSLYRRDVVPGLCS